MQKVEQYLLYECVEALKDVLNEIKSTTAKSLVDKAISRKMDSLLLDVLPENILRNQLLDDYDEHVVLVTEEKGKFNFEEINEAEVVAFSDPTDRSKYLEKFIQQEILDKGNSNLLFGSLLDSKDTIDKWEKFTGVPARLSGACCSITIVKRGEICFSMILNYITQELVIACKDFIGYSYVKNINLKAGNCDFSRWAKINFPKPKENTSYVTFLGKNYRECLDKSDILDNAFTPLEQEPGGPARILYLSNINKNPAGFILSNGEKIGEWIHWLGFCKYNENLVAYSVYPGTFFAKDDILMTPSPPYSVLELKKKSLFLNYDKLRFFENPSRYREMILISHRNNNLIRARVEVNRSRRLFG
jgi:hypothetical protein